MSDQFVSWNFEHWNGLNDGQRIKLAVDMQAEIARLSKELAEEQLHHSLTVLQCEAYQTAIQKARAALVEIQ